MLYEIDRHIQNNSKVISIKYGIGEIVNNFRMYDGVEDYLEVKYFVDEKTRYFCIKHLSDIRLISSKTIVEDALISMNQKLNDNKIDNSLGELPITFIKKDIFLITKKIVELKRKNNLSVDEDLTLHLIIDSLVLEVEEVFNINNSDARGVVNGFLECA